MRDYVKHFIEKIEHFAKKKKEKDLEERKKYVKFPKDTETLFFRKKFSYLLTSMKSNNYNS